MDLNKRSFAIVGALLLGIATLFTAATIAQKVTGPEYTLLKYEMGTKPLKGETLCNYFFRQPYPNGDRVSFTYKESPARTTSAIPRLGDISITIDPQKTVPTATLIGITEDGHQEWTLGMSQSVYDKDRTCLSGISK